MATANILARLLLFAVIALVVVSAPAAHASGLVDHAGADACCAHGEDPAPTADLPSDDDCCATGCQGCFLPCCGGPVSLHVRALTTDAKPASVGAVIDPVVPASAADSGDVFHPPRA